MFGYVKPVPKELLVKEYEFYKATYCGICRAMKKHTGGLSTVTLSYDSVMLALVRMMFVSDEEISSHMKRCIAHPLKKRCMLVENPAIEYTAKAFAILAYHKLLDDIKDEGVGKKILLSPAKPVLRSASKKADFPDIADVVKDRLDKISELEEKKTASVDLPAELFGELLGEIFAYGLDERDALVCREFGTALGRFIYAADAAEDYEEDRKTGKYNPYVLLYGGEVLTEENRKTIKCALILECERMERAVDLMPFGSRVTLENIIRNIIYLGLPKRIEFLDVEKCPRGKCE